MHSYNFFISYSSKDSQPLHICNELEKHGVSCWIAPRNIPAGMPYARAIMQGIENSDIFIVFISSNSVNSEDVLNEIDNAHRLRKQIIPIFISPVKLTSELSYYLNRRQWINLFEGEKAAISLVLNSCSSKNNPQKCQTSNKLLPEPPFELDYLFNTLENPKIKSSDDDFLLAVEDVFHIEGRGTVVTGIIESGKVKVGDVVTIIGEDNKMKSVVTGIEMNRKLIDSAIKGDSCGLLLREISSSSKIKRGYILYIGSNKETVNNIYGGVYLLRTEEGGLASLELSMGDTLTIYNRVNDVNATIVNMSHKKVQNGDFLSMELKFDKRIYLEINDTFALRKADKTIGCGLVSNISL